MLKYLQFSFFLLVFLHGNAQVADTIRWWNPARNDFLVIGGQGWHSDLKSFYDRLPARAEKLVRAPVWNLSQNAAGEYIDFKTDAKKITVRYVVEGPIQLLHFPATGVSGVDLYSINKDGGWNWSGMTYTFRDTIVYNFDNLEAGKPAYAIGREFRLYLPLYNKVRWLEIGTASTNMFAPLPVRNEPPIVIYGTSIAQGGCASRPGMAWTSILSRRLDHTIINLGFSGNGRLEHEVVDLMVEIPARLYVLDCLPNLTDTVTYPLAEVKNRLLNAIWRIRKAHPAVPIVLTEYHQLAANMNAAKRNTVRNINQMLRETLNSLKAGGEKNIHLQQVELGIDDTVDGTHPNDMGMQHYAEAYEKNLRMILNEPMGEVSTTRPVMQYRDAAIYDFGTRHNEILQLNKTNPPGLVFIGNSITHYWGGLPKAPISRGNDSWQQLFDPLKAGNFGFGWDRIENVLWRVYHGELDGFKASKVVLMIGTNNLEFNTDQEIITGLELLVRAIRLRQPKAGILLMGLLPRRGQEGRIKKLNELVIKLARYLKIEGTETGNLFLMNDGRINENLFSDGLHPNTEGYSQLARFLVPKLNK